MNHIKLFEELNIGEPQIGDWVICKDLDVDADGIDEINNFLEKNIGYYLRTPNLNDSNIKINTDLRKTYKYLIQYRNVPDELEEEFNFGEPNDFNCRIMKREEILFWSKDKKDLDPFITANKYNL